MLRISNEGECFCRQSSPESYLVHRRGETETFEHPMHLKCALTWYSTSKQLSCPTCLTPFPVAELLSPPIMLESAKLAPEYTSDLAKRAAQGLVCGAAIVATIHLVRNAFS